MTTKTKAGIARRKGEDWLGDDVHKITNARYRLLQHLPNKLGDNTIWGTTLASGQPHYVVCIGHKPGVPTYTRAFICRDEALSFWARRALA
jgi:hypothetical protein